MKTKIDRLDNFGRGITKVDNIITFVPYALPDEEVEIEIKKQKKKFNEANCLKIYNKSLKRVKPFCPFFGNCGGCSLQHMSYEDTLKFKKEKVYNILNKAKINFSDISISKSSNKRYYRNKVTLKIVNGKIGFYENASHNLVELNNCCIANKAINECIKELKTKSLSDGEIVIRCNHNNELLIIFNGDYNFIREELSSNLKIVGIIINGKIVFGVDYLTTNINDTLFKYSYDSFFQVNNEVASYIFQYIKEKTIDGIVLDLYCGVGTLSIMASFNAKRVYGIEIVPNAIKNAIENAKINNRNNLSFMTGDVANLIDKINDTFDLIIVDPPRKGLDNHTLEFLMNSDVEKIIYVSCDPVTLARDLNVLQKKYIVKEVKLFDMFPYTYHVETAVELIKR